MKIYANGRGGKHRNTAAARTWRVATTAVADAICQQRPAMSRAIALLHAEDETVSYLRRGVTR